MHLSKIGIFCLIQPKYFCCLNTTADANSTRPFISSCAVIVELGRLGKKEQVQAHCFAKSGGRVSKKKKLRDLCHCCEPSKGYRVPLWIRSRFAFVRRALVFTPCVCGRDELVWADGLPGAVPQPLIHRAGHSRRANVDLSPPSGVSFEQRVLKNQTPGSVTQCHLNRGVIGAVSGLCFPTFLPACVLFPLPLHE